MLTAAAPNVLVSIESVTKREMPAFHRSGFAWAAGNVWARVLAGFLLSSTVANALRAEPIPVRYMEGSVHGFLALRTTEGKVLAAGDLVQVTHGSRVKSRLVFRFKDGSLDDETAVFSQHEHFRLISDHHIQKGPSFPHPVDLLINAGNGEVTVRYPDKGKEKVETTHMDLPPDLANGLLLDVLKNVRPDTPETKISYMATTPRPRLIKLSVKPRGDEKFSITGVPHKAMCFTVHAELGGIEGLLAPLLGKEPQDWSVWVAGGEAPAFVKSNGPLYLGAPPWSIQMTSPVWPQAGNVSRRATAAQ